MRRSSGKMKKTKKANTTAKRARRAAPPRRRSGTRKAATRSTSPRSHTVDAVSLLRADHKKMRELLAALKNAETAARRQKVLAQVEQELKAHTTIEEEIFYPAFRDAAEKKDDRQLFYEATEEHRAADMILKEVGRADTESGDVFAGRAKVLKEIVEHHASEEERDMFPRARQLLAPDEMRRLGQEMAARKRSLTGHDESTLQKVAAMVGFS